MSAAQVIGRALQGLGNGVTMMGQQLREGRLQALEREERSRLADADRSFRASEAENDRSFRASQAASDRAFRSDLQEDAQAHDGKMLSEKQALDKPLIDARVDLTNAQAENERKGIGRSSSSAAVLSRDHLKKIYMSSSDGAQREGETDEQYKRRVNSWLIAQETQKAETPTSDLRLRVWKELKGTRVETERDGKPWRGDFEKLSIEEQLARVDALIARLKDSDSTNAELGAKRQSEEKPDEQGPSGSGTEDDPFQASNQADIEWFKANAPKGSVISINGKNYSK